MTKIVAQRIVMLAAAGAMLAFFTQTAPAQFATPGLDLNPDSSRRLTPEEKEKMQEIDKDYKATMKKVPDKKAYDPWAGARQDSSNAPTTKR
jgi:predicted transglutaminase-like cysteine proteinase